MGDSIGVTHGRGMFPPLFSAYGRKDNAMSKEIQIFANDQFGEVRTLTKDGEPWFVGKDVAEILGYSNPRDALAKRVDDEDKGVAKCDTLGGAQELTIINESGLYSLILSSKLSMARAFKRWVTSEVLPAIRKHGEYTAPKVSQKRLGEVNSAARIIRQTLKEAGMAPQFVAVAMKSLYAPVGVEIPLEGVTLNKQLFDATAIAKQLGVLSRSANRTHTQSLRSSRRWTCCRRKKSLPRSRAQSAATPERMCNIRNLLLPRSACGWNATSTQNALNIEARSTRCGTVQQHKYPIPGSRFYQ